MIYLTRHNNSSLGNLYGTLVASAFSYEMVFCSMFENQAVNTHRDVTDGKDVKLTKHNPLDGISS